MSNRPKIKFALALSALAVVAAFSVNDSRAADQDLPAGKGVEIVRDKCISCHEADLITSQRLSKQGWTREVDKMIRWGAVVTEAEKEPLVDYLAANFGPRPAAKNDDNERGKGIFESKCLACHEVDLTRQQRLSRQGWTREVEKMIRWGAAVTEEEKGDLVDYLFKNYGPRPK
jgi:mono/diheme cytochrome c family protein